MKTLLIGLSALLAVSAVPTVGRAQEQPPAEQPYNGEAQYADPGTDPGVEYDPQAGAAAAGDAGALPEQSEFGYFGPHPLPYDQGGAFCTQQGAHQHPFPVFDSHLFRQVNGYAYFVGDPSDFGYSTGTYLYGGNHPIDWVNGAGYCYFGWPHRHLFAPTSAQYVLQSGAYIYNGIWAPDYYSQLPLYSTYFSGYYRQWYLGNRYYSLRPAHTYIGWGWHQPYGRGYFPRYGAPGYRGPIYRGPGYGGPVYRGPGYGGYRAPGYGAPVYRAPGYGGQVYRGPGYGGPVYRAPGYGGPVYRGPGYGGQVYRPAPAYRPGPVYQASPGFHQPPAFHQAPAFRPAPSFHPAPSFRPAPSFHSAPHFSAPVNHSAPAFHGHFGRR